MASALFVTFLDRLVKIPSDYPSWATYEAKNGYVLDICRQDDSYMVSHYSNKDSDPESQYIAEAAQFRSILAEIPIDARPKSISLYKDGELVVKEEY